MAAERRRPPIVVDRELTTLARECHRQFAARVDVAEQHLADGSATFLPRVPRFDDRGYASGNERQGKRTAVDEDRNHRLARLEHGLDEILLIAHQTEIGDIAEVV